MNPRKHPRAGKLRLIVQGRGRHDQACGIAAAPPHLPVDLLRLPGETLEQLAHRALQTVVGQGVVVLFLFYPEEVTH